MKKTKSFLAILLIACAAVAMTFVFTACNGIVKDDDGNVKYEIYGNLNYVLDEATDEYICTGTDKHNIANVVIAAKVNDKNVTSIAADAFAGHSEITGITIPESIKTIGSNAFNWCSGLTNVNLGSVTVGDGAFANCTRLATVNITANTKIGADVFFHTAYYDNKSNWDGNALYLEYNEGEYAAPEKRSVLLNVNSDVKGAFAVKDNTTAIADEAFDGCYKLTDVTLPVSLKSVGAYAFVGCSNISSLTYAGTAAQWAEVVTGENWKLGVTAEVTTATVSE